MPTEAEEQILGQTWQGRVRGIRAFCAVVGWVFGDGQGGASKHEVQAGSPRADLKRLNRHPCASPARRPRHWRPDVASPLQTEVMRPEREERPLVPAILGVGVNLGRLTVLFLRTVHTTRCSAHRRPSTGCPHARTPAQRHVVLINSALDRFLLDEHSAIALLKHSSSTSARRRTHRHHTTELQDMSQTYHGPDPTYTSPRAIVACRTLDTLGYMVVTIHQPLPFDPMFPSPLFHMKNLVHPQQDLPKSRGPGIQPRLHEICVFRCFMNTESQVAMLHGAIDSYPHHPVALSTVIQRRRKNIEQHRAIIYSPH